MKILLIALKDWRHRLKASIILGSILGLVPALLLGQAVKEGQTPISLVLGGSTLSIGFATLILCGDLISDERNRGTMIFLLSQPIRDWEIAFGKHVALLLIMLPAIIVNSIATSFLTSINVATGFLYFVCLMFFTFAGGGLLLFVSAQFKRLPAIFGMWCLYAILLSTPGAFYASSHVPESWGPAFLVFLITLPFLTPLFVGIVEYIKLYFPFLMTGMTNKGPGAVFSLLLKIIENPAAFIPNFLIPAWNSTVLLLSGAAIALERPSIYGAIGSTTAMLSMGLLFGFLASKQFRKRTPGID
jgi:ABC-type transport system involved in multi-copper enzyme maturation permease subunit